MIRIWNDILEEGIGFPKTGILTPYSGLAFFCQQSFTGVAEDTDSNEILGLYILHPNNIGTCGHISNTSYAVKKFGEVFISENNWFLIVFRRQRKLVLKYYSSMLLSTQIMIRFIFTKSLALISLG